MLLARGPPPPPPPRRDVSLAAAMEGRWSSPRPASGFLSCVGALRLFDDDGGAWEGFDELGQLTTEQLLLFFVFFAVEEEEDADPVKTRAEDGSSSASGSEDSVRSASWWLRRQRPEDGELSTLRWPRQVLSEL